MTKRKIVATLALGAALLVTGCANNDTEQQPTKKVTQKVQQKEAQTPFTGEMKQISSMRPILATINNQVEARPQSGLASADMIYEMLAEGNTTRLLALFQSEMPTEVGPIRSARKYFIDIAKGYDAFYIAHGYSPEAKQLLGANVVDNINGMDHDGTLFRRSSERVAPHNSYISEASITEAADLTNTSLEMSTTSPYRFYKKDEAIKEGISVENFALNFNGGVPFNSSFTYNHEDSNYIRSSNGYDTTDLLTNKPVEIHNIIIIEAPHQSIDEKDRQAIDLLIGGNARIYQNGEMREVKWQSKGGLPIPVEENGDVVKLVPGKTWIDIIPTVPGMANTVTNY